MKKKQIFTLASAALLLVGVVLWLFIGSVKFHFGDKSGVFTGLKMISGDIYTYQSVLPVLGEQSFTFPVTGFNVISLLVPIVGLIAVAFGVLSCYIKSNEKITISLFGFTTFLFLLAAITMSLSHVDSLRQYLNIIPDGYEYSYGWSFALGTYLSIGLGLAATGVSVFSLLKVKE